MSHLLSYQRIMGAISSGIKQLGGEADHPPPTSAEVKKTRVTFFISS
jgi:hypothetical protein